MIQITTEPLSSVFVERGKINKTQIYQSNNSKGITEIALLELSPNAKIKRHKHEKDNEIYIFIITKKFKICHIGGEHELENDTDEILYVLSIKWK